MQPRHKDRQAYFQEQAYTTQQYVIPFIEDVRPLSDHAQVLEIGCGEGGNMLPFLERGYPVTGIDLSPRKIENARKFYADHPNAANLKLIHEDIYNIKDDLRYDLIMMRDVLEHIHDQEKFMHFVKRFLKDGGLFFLGFPPWQNPFGGHQQTCESKWLSKLPYFHILPRGMYKNVLKAFGEKEGNVESLLEIHETRITIERFERILATERYQVLKNTFYAINPNYEVKFKLKPRKQWPVVAKTPLVRNFLITTCYYLISKQTTTHAY